MPNINADDPPEEFEDFEPPEPPEPEEPEEPEEDGDDLDIIFNEPPMRRHPYPGVRIAPDWAGLRGDIPVRQYGWADFENTVGDVFKRPPIADDKKDCIIGLELENETLEPFDLPSVSGWQFHPEGSLRNFGFEYVQSTPACVEVSLGRCKHLLKYLKQRVEPQLLLNSSRTSTHVHFDVCHYTFKDVLNFACTYWILEEYLSNFCGNTRKGNLFCLRLKDSAAIQVFIKAAIAEGSPWSIPLSRNDYRYSALNFASIPKFGTLEFRMMAGTDNLEDIETWVRALENIKNFALRFKNPTELSQFFLKDCEARQFPRTVLGPELARKITMSSGRTPSEIETEVRSGFMMVYPIMAAHSSWDFSKEIAEEAIKRAEEQVRVRLALEEQARQAAAREVLNRSTRMIMTRPEGQDELPDNVDDINLVEVFDIIDE